ncbi:unnamed protein product [Spirodela intermedia]|uniref:Uncharacterized protein n=1 Tax=Spirodela intermedia TaxID=51605 RepID=A0A7I8J8Y6_SPIIN|nr:unnamed protein product [Spirodela intermedia]CAA6665893.1 unnamed protein product [Spirodela intermedia]
MEELAGLDLVSSQKADERVEELLEGEASIAVGVERNLAETLSLNELNEVNCFAGCEALQEEADAIRSRRSQLEERAKKCTDGSRVFAVEEKEVGDMSALLEAKVKALASQKCPMIGKVVRYKNLSLILEDQVLAMDIEHKVSSVWQREMLHAVEEMKRREGLHVKEILKLQTENKKLEYARMRAEMAVTYWQKKYAELETRSLGNMDMKRNLGIKVGRNIPERPDIDEFCKETKSRHLPKLNSEDVTRESESAVQAGLGTSCAGGVVVITDSEDEMEKQNYDSRKGSHLERLCSHGDEGGERFSNELPMALKLDVTMGSADSTPGENWISASTPKRRRMSTVVMSDSEDAEDEPKERFSNELPRALKLDVTMGSADSSPGENRISASTPKRNRMSTVVMSDSEDAESEPKVPTEEIKKKKIKAIEDCQSSSSNCSLADYSNEDDQKVLRMPSRRHLIPLSQLGEVRGRGKLTYSRDSGTPMFSSGVQESSSVRNKGNVRQRLEFPTVEGAKGDSLEEFIADESNPSDEEVCDMSSEQEVSSDSSTDHVFARIRREKSSMKWEYEGDMLASFGKDPVICMKAVCALYRQQTPDEKSVKGTLLTNNRGFNRIDAKRGSFIAEFLTDGNSVGPLVKSLATHYSKQLFMIYQSGEDPHFRPA